MKHSIVQPDRLAGLLFVLCGGAFAFGAGAYEMGTTAQMGPGYFPRLLGGLLTLLGIAIFATAQSRTAPASSGNLPWRPLAAVICAVAIFGFLLKPLGLFLASVLLAGVASLGQRAPRWREVALTALVLALTACAIFAWGLQLPLPVWPGQG